ncbi:hypothetical protein Agabi119p4_419 [Agaricus bisporus var. burnettii]|uniref:F-box domain-containing protein n=1 Tax=Agaricus bisporus var. burnettii TaxID=192524 RepID=A0A8H7KL51_AGABI|nr:hypothetical protein Agabi119p4_419 [Agaricus bisporus var. burnettii]
MSFATLPGELYTAIVEQLDPSLWAPVVLALSRVLPSAPIPLQLLFHTIRIKQPQQAVSLFLRLEKASNVHGSSQDICPTWVKEFSVASWSVDADVIINIVRLLPNLTSLNVRIGPSNFSPEHLEQLLENPIGKLKQLSLRFRPYVNKASYYQFHKGVYYDSVLLAIAKWPPQEMPAISIVQDPQTMNVDTARKPSFAQPIVFFRIDPYLSIMIHSPSLAHSMKALRLRIPSRPVARALFWTCLPAHLIIDGCTDLRQGEWAALGKRCALVGVKRARDREKELKAWMEEKWVENHETIGSDIEPAQMVDLPSRTIPRRQRPGRRGLATATITLRDHSTENSSRSSSHSRDDIKPKSVVPKTRILPFVPRLETLAATPTIGIETSKRLAIRAEFEAGWAEGIAQLAVTRARMRTSARNGVRLLRFAEDGENKSDPVHGMEGLVDVNSQDEDIFATALSTAPNLCLAGRGGDEHVAGCGHTIARNIWSEAVEGD